MVKYKTTTPETKKSEELFFRPFVVKYRYSLKG